MYVVLHKLSSQMHLCLCRPVARPWRVTLLTRIQVEWSEPWILVVLCFHFSTFLLILLTRRWVYAQAALLVALASVCLAAERINEWAAANYRYVDLLGDGSGACDVRVRVPSFVPELVSQPAQNGSQTILQFFQNSK